MATAKSTPIRGREETVSGSDPTYFSHHHDSTTVQSENTASETSSRRARDSDISSQSTAPVREGDASSQAVVNTPFPNEHVASKNTPAAIDQHTFTPSNDYHFPDHVSLQSHSHEDDPDNDVATICSDTTELTDVWDDDDIDTRSDTTDYDALPNWTVHRIQNRFGVWVEYYTYDTHFW